MVPGPARGLAYAISAYSIWGLFPVYWKWLAHVDPVEVLAHRILWTVPFVALILTVTAGWRPVQEILRAPSRLLPLVLTSVLISANWGIYIWAVASGRVVEGSLGYYLSPLLSVSVGVLIFRDRLTRWQVFAVFLATLGVVNEMFSLGHVPWAALGVGFSFALYGALRKLTPIDAPSGLFLETLLIAPFALGWVLWLDVAGEAGFLNADGRTDALLALGGVVTAVPLLLYVGAARRLALSTVGILFYMTPTLQLGIGVLVYGEPFPVSRGITFGLIWAALIVFTVESQLRRHRMAAKPKTEQP